MTIVVIGVLLMIAGLLTMWRCRARPKPLRRFTVYTKDGISEIWR